MKILIIGPHGGGYIFLPNSLNYLQIKRPKHGIEKPEIFSTLFFALLPVFRILRILNKIF